MKNTIYTRLLQRFVFWQAVVVFIIIASLVGCKDDGILGLEVQPDGQYDTLALTDTFSVRGFTIEGVRQRSDEAQSFLGRIQSNEFGTTESALIFNVALVTGNLSLDWEGYTVDSAVLHIRPNQIFGVPQDEIPIGIYQLNDALDVDEDYYSDFDPEINPTAVSTSKLMYSRQIRSTDTIKVQGDPEPFQFRFPLENSVGETLLTLLKLNKGNDYDTKAFQSDFHGFMIKPEPGLSGEAVGAIYSMALLTGESGIRLYVSNNTEQEVIAFPINSQCARINQFSHDYQGSLAETYLNNSSTNDDVLFVQGMSGLRSEIQIPGLYNFGAFNNTAVAKATLSFTLSDNQHAELSNSSRLFLLDLDKDGNESLTLDFAYSPTRNGGRFNSEINGYEFDITRHVQRILDAAKSGNDINYGLRLHAQVPVLNGNDTAHNVIQGMDNIALKVYHTDLNN